MIDRTDPNIAAFVDECGVTTIQTTTFDYSLLPDRAREDVETETQNIRNRAKRMADDIVQIGLAARRVKGQLDHGLFVQWIDAEFRMEFGWSYQTLARFMQVSEHFQSSQIEKFGKSALYLLAQDSTPEEARQEARERAEAGEAISHSTAKEIVQRHRVPVWEPGQPEEDWAGEARSIIAQAEQLTSPIQRIDTIKRAYRPITFTRDKGTEQALRTKANAILEEAKADLRAALQKRGIQIISERHQGGDRFYTLSGAVEGEWLMTDMETFLSPEPEPDSLPDSLRFELSRLGWELRSSRQSSHAGTLYTLCSDGGCGPGEERGVEGWQQMLEDLLDDEQRMFVSKARAFIAENKFDHAYSMINRLTDAKRLELRAEVDRAIDANFQTRQTQAITQKANLDEIEIATTAGVRRVHILYRHNLLAVHETIGGEGFTVTHVQTGRLIARSRTLREAQDVVNDLSALDWDFEIELPLAIRDDFRRIAKRLLDAGYAVEIPLLKGVETGAIAPSGFVRMIDDAAEAAPAAPLLSPAAQRMAHLQASYPTGSLVVWAKADGTEHLMKVMGVSFSGERLKLLPHGEQRMSKMRDVDPAKCRLAIDADDFLLVEDEQEVDDEDEQEVDDEDEQEAQQYHAKLLKQTEGCIGKFTLGQTKLIRLMLGIQTNDFISVQDLASLLVERYGDHPEFVRIMKIEGRW